MIKFNAEDSIEFILSSNHDVLKDIKIVYRGRLLSIPAVCKLFTKTATSDQLNELIFQLCQLNYSLNYCGVYYEEVYIEP